MKVDWRNEEITFVNIGQATPYQVLNVEFLMKSVSIVSLKEVDVVP